MRQNKWLVLGFLVVGILLIIFWLIQPHEKKITDHELISAKIGRSPQLTLEVVNTPLSMTQGLSQRDELGSDGMLFIFNQAQTRVFWMKEMKFDLDLIWLNNFRVMGITTAVPAPEADTLDQDLPLYTSPAVTDMVLEVLAGQTQEWQIQVGDRLEF